jgi:hypothetical protein
VAEEDAGQRLDLDLPHRVKLRLREPAHLRLHELDVVDDLRRQGRDDVLDLAGREQEAVGRPVVELGRVLAHGLVSAFADVGDDAGHGLLDVGQVLGRLRRRDRFLQVCDAHGW